MLFLVETKLLSGDASCRLYLILAGLGESPRGVNCLLRLHCGAFMVKSERCGGASLLNFLSSKQTSFVVESTRVNTRILKHSCGLHFIVSS